MIAAAQLWADPKIVYPVAIAAVALLVATIWLFRRQKRTGRQAAMICLLASVGLHIALIFLVPLIPSIGAGRFSSQEEPDEIGVDAVALSSFDSDMNFEEVSGTDADAAIAPLPVSELVDLLDEPQPKTTEKTENETELSASEPLAESIPHSLAINESPADASPADYASELSDWFEETVEADLADRSLSTSEITPTQVTDALTTQRATDDAFHQVSAANRGASANAATSSVAGDLQSDFANRVGSAKQRALMETGGSMETEAAVESALRFLAAGQRADGAWDPRASNAGQERAPLGETRGNAGSRAETAITGLAILSLVGAGNTHQQGPYAENVYRGLAYLIQKQKPDGSLAGNATVYESTYCHGMAALAMCEAAAMTGDESAVECARRAVAYTTRLQHPTTGGWRYTAGDPGDLSQLGWQAMVIDGGHRAGLPIDDRSVAGIERFLYSVRAGQHGGLASYRPGEAPSRTMTAEALATKLLVGSSVSPNEIAEAENSLLQQTPGVGQDNYYYWYYATLALHQLQDDAWLTWNDSLKRRLLSTQRSDGSWPTDSVWGGYGGSVYTTSMATLCLESYYRHAVRDGSENGLPQRSARK